MLTQAERRQPRATGGRSRRWLAGAAALGLGAAVWAGSTWRASAAAGPGPITDSRAWTVYHGDRAGTGAATSVAAVDTARRAWTSAVLDGQIYGEPLVAAGRVYVATENDTVYALSTATGATVWSVHVGRAVPASSLPCGDIAPVVGITGTPVIDRARGEIFVVADALVHGKPAHELVGLATASGRRELVQNVDPPGANTAALLQRTGLNLAGGRVVFGFGGNDGDCATYRGRVVAVPAAGGKPAFFTVDAARGESQGAVWMGGAAAAVDAAGHVWVSVGNGSVRSAKHAYDHSDSVLELSSSMRLLQFFAPRDWAASNARDLDMALAPVLLPGGEVLLAGKARIVYLLNGGHLGGIGGQQAALAQACGTDIAGGSARVGMTAYLPCVGGTIAVRAAKSPPKLRLLWDSATGGGPPIVAAGLVWTIGQNGRLYGLQPGTGAIRRQVAIGSPANHFPTPSVGDGLLLAATARRVVAFRATAGAAPGQAGGGQSRATGARRPDGRSRTVSDALPGGAIAGIAVGALVLVGATFWLTRIRVSPRRRSGG